MTGILQVLSLLAGAFLLLTGIRTLRNGLTSLPGRRIGTFLAGSTRSPLWGYVLGFAVAALIRSANVAVFLTAELAACGLLEVRNTAGILLGAGAGASVSAQLDWLPGPPAAGAEVAVLLAPVAAIAGAVLYAKKKTAPLGRTLLGLSILMLGVMGMSDAVRQAAASGWFSSLLSRSSGSPLRCLTAGLAMGFVLQSPTAGVAAMQEMAPAGFLSGRVVFALMIGSWLGGSVMVGLFCRLAGARGGRVGTVYVCVHLLAAAFLIAALPMAHGLGLTKAFWDAAMNRRSITNLHAVCRLASSLFLLPMADLIGRVFCEDTGSRKKT